jgi:hypothetical protein
MSTYEPAQVAVATVRGVEGVRIFRSQDDWISGDDVAGIFWHTESDVTDIRPLIALDLDDPAFTAAALRDTLPEKARDHDRFDVEVLRLARQIEAAVKPPRIPEPGLGKHVTAGKPDGTRAEFVRVGSRHWSEIGTGSGWDWSELKDPEAVSS